MRLFTVRRLVVACATSAASVAVLVGPSSAAALPGFCKGSAITGAGSSAQKLAQKEVWDSEEAKGKGLGFNNGTNVDACSAANKSNKEKKEPEVKYESIGSGGGLERWGVEGAKTFLTTTGFVGTDEPVNTTQKEEVENHGKLKNGGEVQSIPVLQFSIAPIIHLPAGCEATSTAAPGRLVLNNQTLEKIWTAEITKWSQIKENGDEVKQNAGSAEVCNPEAEIKHVVRLDKSGTTHVYKAYLGLIQGHRKDANFELEEGLGTKSWVETDQGSLNTKWPAADKVIRPAAKGGGEEAAKVFVEASSIGYANLADARGKFGGAAAKEIFWAEVQNNGDSVKSEEAPTYADPATNGDVAAIANSNCVSEKYTNGLGKKFPPATTALVWSEVTTETKQLHYPLCGVTYDMALGSKVAGKESTMEEYGFSEEQVQTVNDYLNFVVDAATNGGQTEVVGHDYEKLPSSLSDIAQDGVDEIH
jgi:ABC-type phosphate transport system substrate-binding protein